MKRAFCAAEGSLFIAYVGALLSVFIVKSGYEMIRDTLDEILGKRAEAELTRKIRALLTEEEAVIGAYDLFLNDYGPDRFYGTVHLELPDTMTVEEVDVLTQGRCGGGNTK